MKKTLVIASLLALSLSACGINNNTPERQAVLKELAEFTKKCRENPEDKECVEYRQMYGN